MEFLSGNCWNLTVCIRRTPYTKSMNKSGCSSSICSTGCYSCKQIMFLQSTNFRCHTRTQLKNFRGPQYRYFQNTSLLSWKIFFEIFQQTHIWSTAALKQTLFNSLLQEICAAITDVRKCTYQQQTQWLILQVCYRRQLNLHFRLKTARESSRVSVIRCGLWPSTFPWFKILWLLSVRKFKR